MSHSLYLLRRLKGDRTYIYRISAFVVFVSMQLVTSLVLHFHENGQLRYLEILNIVVGIVIASIFVIGAIDLSKRNIHFESVKNERIEIESKFENSQDLLFRIDSETRQEVGGWLHGTLQPQLTRLAKDIREKKESDCEKVAQQVDEISEKFVRAYSHELFPPALIISLEVGLETLLDGRAELILDYRLTNESPIGYSVSSLKKENNESERPLRLTLGRERGYAAYRIIEEAVANAEKKSNTSKILVDVRVESETVRLSVFDNGSPVPENARQGLGHSIINSFIQRFDGSWSLENVVDGVELTALIPYTPVTVAEKLRNRYQVDT
jgi:signal transduction histidine kinase